MTFLPERLRQARDRRGITQRQLAELCGLLGNQISRYEQGTNDPSTDVLARLAHHLRVTTDYLVGLSDDPQGNEKFELTADEVELLAAYMAGNAAKIMQLSATRLTQLEQQSET